MTSPPNSPEASISQVKRNSLYPTLAFVAIALIAAGLLLWRSQPRSQLRTDQAGGRAAIGDPQSIEGEVAFFSAPSANSPNLVLASPPRHVHIGDEISTGSGSVRLVFENGLETSLESGSRLRLLAGRDASEKFALELESGSLALIKSDLRQPRTRVEVDGKSLELGSEPLSAGELPAARLIANPRAAEMAGSFDEPLSPAEESVTEADSVGGGAKGRLSTEGQLSDRDIARSMKTQAGFFKRCALAYLERQRKGTPAHDRTAPSPATSRDSASLAENAPIAVLMNFTVLPSGRAVDAKVSGGAQDEKLGRCLGDVIERAPFRRFQGAAIAVADYSISIE